MAKSNPLAVAYARCRAVGVPLDRLGDAELTLRVTPDGQLHATSCPETRGRGGPRTVTLPFTDLLAVEESRTCRYARGLCSLITGLDEDASAYLKTLSARVLGARDLDQALRSHRLLTAVRIWGLLRLRSRTEGVAADASPLGVPTKGAVPLDENVKAWLRSYETSVLETFETALSALPGSTRGERLVALLTAHARTLDAVAHAGASPLLQLRTTRVLTGPLLAYEVLSGVLRARLTGEPFDEHTVLEDLAARGVAAQHLREGTRLLAGLRAAVVAAETFLAAPPSPTGPTGPTGPTAELCRVALSVTSHRHPSTSDVTALAVAVLAGSLDDVDTGAVARDVDSSTAAGHVLEKRSSLMRGVVLAPAPAAAAAAALEAVNPAATRASDSSAEADRSQRFAVLTEPFLDRADDVPGPVLELTMRLWELPGRSASPSGPEGVLTFPMHAFRAAEGILN